MDRRVYVFGAAIGIAAVIGRAAYNAHLQGLVDAESDPYRAEKLDAFDKSRLQDGLIRSAMQNAFDAITGSGGGDDQQNIDNQFYRKLGGKLWPAPPTGYQYISKAASSYPCTYADDPTKSPTSNQHAREAACPWIADTSHTAIYQLSPCLPGHQCADINSGIFEPLHNDGTIPLGINKYNLPYDPGGYL